MFKHELKEYIKSERSGIFLVKKVAKITWVRMELSNDNKVNNKTVIKKY